MIKQLLTLGLLVLNSVGNLNSIANTPIPDGRSIFHNTIDEADSTKENKNYSEAIQLYEEALIYSTGDIFFESYIHSTIGYLYEKENNYTASLEHHLEAYQLQPEIPAFTNNLAFACAKSNTCLDYAQRLAETFTELEPYNHVGWATLAYIELNTNQNDSAIVHYQKAIDLSENDSNLKNEDIGHYHFYMSEILRKQGKNEEAKRHRITAENLGYQE